MALTTIFGTLTAATGGELDVNFAEVGALTTLPCILTGTNALQLTQQANCPTIGAYGNYLRLSGIISATNTTTSTLQLGALGFKNIYKDTATGPALLTGGEMQAGNAGVWVYDSALNGGVGGWHFQAPATGLGQVVASWSPVDASGASIGAFTSVSANYTQIGNIIFYYAQLTFPSTANGANAVIGGLPLASANQNYAQTFGEAHCTTVSSLQLGQVVKNTTHINLLQSTAAAVVNSTLSLATIVLTGFYPIA